MDAQNITVSSLSFLAYSFSFDRWRNMLFLNSEDSSHQWEINNIGVSLKLQNRITLLTISHLHGFQRFFFEAGDYRTLYYYFKNLGFNLKGSPEPTIKE